MRRSLLILPALVLVLVGGIIVTSAGEQPGYKSQSMPGNYQFLTITNPSAIDQDGFPAFYGNGPQQIMFHLDLSGQDILTSQVPFMVQIVSSDWTRVLYSQNLTYSGPTDFILSVPKLDYGTYVLVILIGQRPTYWQVFSVDSESGQLLGSFLIVAGIVLAIAALYPEKGGRYK